MKNEVAVVTGGGGHIGGRIARELALDGTRVAVCDINTGTIRSIVDEINGDGGEAVAFSINVKDPDDVNRMMQDVITGFGRVDILVTAAGGSARGRMNCLVDQDDDIIRDVIELNLFGSIYCARAAARYMIGQGHGRIIFLGSTVGVQGLKRCVEYSASKGGIYAMTKSLAMELGEYGITVNCVSPGIVKRPEETRDTTQTNYLNRDGTAVDIAGMVAFLASDRASFITGQNHIIDGGRSLGLKGSN